MSKAGQIESLTVNKLYALVINLYRFMINTDILKFHREIVRPDSRLSNHIFSERALVAWTES